MRRGQRGIAGPKIQVNQWDALSIEERSCCESLIVATLNLCVSQGYDRTTVDQIIAAAGVSPRDFTRYFASKDAVIMSLVIDVLHATVAALADVDTEIDPTESLLLATAAALIDITNGRGVMTLDRMLAMSHIVNSNRDLQQRASAARKQVLAQGLADSMRVDPQTQEVQRAVTMWSAIAAGLYLDQQSMPAGYDPRHDNMLPERIIAHASETFDHVMGQVLRKTS